MAICTSGRQRCIFCASAVQIVPRTFYTTISDFAEIYLMANALEAEELHNSTFCSVVLDFNAEIE